MMHDYIIQTCLRLTLLAPQKAAARANFRSFTIPLPHRKHSVHRYPER